MKKLKKIWPIYNKIVSASKTKDEKLIGKKSTAHLYLMSKEDVAFYTSTLYVGIRRDYFKKQEKFEKWLKNSRTLEYNFVPIELKYFNVENEEEGTWYIRC